MVYLFKNGSNWTLKKVLFMQLHFIKYNPLRGGLYEPLPEWIRAPGACFNIKTYDGDYFSANLVSFFPVKEGTDDPLVYLNWRDYFFF